MAINVSVSREWTPLYSINQVYHVLIRFPSAVNGRPSTAGAMSKIVQALFPSAVNGRPSTADSATYCTVFKFPSAVNGRPSTADPT